MILFLIISIIYQILNKKELKNNYEKLKSYCSKIPFFYFFISAAFIVLFFSFPLLGDVQMDAALYHIPSITWYEYYASVPGIANLEERIGFNSSYLLLSSIFTFRFILDSPLYLVNFLFAVLVFLWLFKEMVESKFEVKRTIAFVLLSVFLWSNQYMFTSTSTDLLPNLIVFYLTIKVFLYPHLMEKKVLLWLLLPALFLTLKLSIFPFTIVIFIYFVVRLLKQRKIKVISIVVFLNAFMVLAWCTHTVIISGYVIYPIHFLDFFDVDWKVPREIAIAEMDYINYYGQLNTLIGVFKLIKVSLPAFPYIGNHILFYINGAVYIFVLFSIFIFIFAFFSKKLKATIPSFCFIIIISLIFVLTYWLFAAPFYRFAVGLLFSIIFSAISVLLCLKKEMFFKPVIGVIIVIVSLGIFANRTFKYIIKDNNITSDIIQSALIKPLSLHQKIKHQEVINYECFKLNNGIIINITNGYYLLDVIPAASSLPVDIGIYQDHHDIEARGSKIEDGFRSKKREKK